MPSTKSRPTRGRSPRRRSTPFANRHDAVLAIVGLLALYFVKNAIGRRQERGRRRPVTRVERDAGADRESGLVGVGRQAIRDATNDVTRARFIRIRQNDDEFIAAKSGGSVRRS